MPKQLGVKSNLGLYIYATAAIFLGVLGLISGDFAATWQNVSTNLPFRAPLARLTACVELAAGLCLLYRLTARVGALTLTAVYSVFTLLWIPKALINLGNYDPIGNVFEEFSLVAAGLVLCASLSPTGSWMKRQQGLCVLLFAICPISFGIVHITGMPGLLGAIPGWLPPSRMFWAYVTTLGFFAAAVAILTGIVAPLAARMLVLEIMLFELLFWIPNLLAGPRSHFNWAGNAISIAIVGAAWIVSDSIATSRLTIRESASDRTPRRNGV